MASRPRISERRRAGLRDWRNGMIDLTMNRWSSAHKLLTSALDQLVDAFFEDREANADLFTIAHRIGFVVEEEFGCRFKFDDERGGYYNDCPVPNLHSRVGMSIGGSARSRCSICEAEEFECDHIPGRIYDGRTAVREVFDIQLDHVALTANPDFTYTFRMNTVRSKAEVRAMIGRDLRAGESLFSHHCRDCYGRHYARPDDLDRSLWEPLAPAETGD